MFPHQSEGLPNISEHVYTHCQTQKLVVPVVEVVREEVLVAEVAVAEVVVSVAAQEIAQRSPHHSCPISKSIHLKIHT